MFVIVLSIAVPAGAAPYDWYGRTVDVEAWAQSSPSAQQYEVLVGMDFGEGEEYTFGYRWNDGDTVTRPTRVPGDLDYVDYLTYTGNYGLEAAGNTSEAAILALDTLADMALTTLYHGVFGQSVTNIYYRTSEMGISITGQSWPALWLCGREGYMDWMGIWHPAVSASDRTWEIADFGISGRVLASGYWDGWSQRASDWSTDEPNIAPVPEPASISLLVLAGVAMVFRRRNRSRA